MMENSVKDAGWIPISTSIIQSVDSDNTANMMIFVVRLIDIKIII
jgi:hypothetical protein